MSKIKHLLRKLHIGSGAGINDHQNHHHQRIPEPRPARAPEAPCPPLTSNGRIAAVESPPDRTAGDAGGGGGGVDFSLLEEEFQVQLALAISVSDPDVRDDPESAQIDAAKRISLGYCPVAAAVAPPMADVDALVESLSVRYLTYNVVNYNEKVLDGFYDVYGITSNSIYQVKMPLLLDLQAISVGDNVDYEVILVNRFVDPELREIEKRAYIMLLESRVSDGLDLCGLIQKIADIVVDRMGGPVGDADEMSRKWKRSSYELRNAMNTVILPLGRLDVGLSRHRALLFKVLADKINLPCLLVKGSFYTGSDDGAVNLIKIDDGSEYIIDLMGAPGTLIPAEVPSSHLLSAGFDICGFTGLMDTPRCSYSLLGEGPGPLTVSPNLDRVFQVDSQMLEEALFTGTKTSEHDVNLFGKTQTNKLEHGFEKSFLSSLKLCESSSSTEKPSSAQKNKVKNVSKYVISAAKNPEFSQQLHAVLLESGASSPPDFFADIGPQDLGEQVVHKEVQQTNCLHADNEFLLSNGQPSVSLSGDNSLNNIRCVYKSERSTEERGEQRGELETNAFKLSLPSSTTSEGFVLVHNINEKFEINATDLDTFSDNPFGMLGRAMHENQFRGSSLPYAVDSYQLQHEDAIASDGKWGFQQKIGRISNVETGNESVEKSTDRANNGYSEGINPVLGEVAEWEIPWEDLQIGERIGIGSYGEVYHADWNGTEVGVKKFLDQDFSGDALVQFRCEAEIMLRLRHPNVVLFMGAVTRPPHLSILTEFLPRGSLYRLLHRPNPLLDEKRRMKMAIDVAKGMNYLHTSHPTIVHRDLKSPNLLVDKNWVVKVCDFGLSRIKHHTFLSSKSTAGTPEWMAPEVLRNEPANEKCDVYSFGVILWELATCQIPWKGLNPMQVVGAVGFQNRRLEIPEDTDPAIAQIIHDCWQTEPNLRPSFSQLITRLRCVQRLLVERTNHKS